MQPDIIQDSQIPLLEGSYLQATGQASSDASNEVYKPNTQVDQSFPPAIVAQETASQSLDTATKRIKGNYQFESLGAISVGQFSQGVSGEVKISPDGIVAKNVNGDTTVGIDGSTGDATFKGTLQADTIIAGDNNIKMEQGGVGGRIVFYVSGVPVILIGDPS